MLLRLRSCSALVLLVACSTSDPEAIDRCKDEVLGRSEAIFDGTPTEAYPAVGRLRSTAGSLCTATLVTERKLVSAAHCVPSDPTALYFELVGEDDRTRRRVDVIDARVGEMFGDPRATHLEDISVLILAESITEVEPMALATSLPEAGTEVSLVGFGPTREDAGDHGTRRAGAMTIAAEEREDTSFKLVGPESSCGGDSGGPTLYEGPGGAVVLGVTSSGGCNGRFSYATRVDAFAELIDLDEELPPVEGELTEVQTVGRVSLPSGEGWPNVRIRFTGPRDEEVATDGDGGFSTILLEGEYQAEVEGTRDGQAYAGRTTCYATPPVSGCEIRVEPAEPEPEETLCTDECYFAADGECDDGGPGAAYHLCGFGTDCSDCGAREEADRPADPPFDRVESACER